MSLQLQNTLSGKKEFFKPVNPDHVRIYACGPTVYNFAHIGNARMAVVNDLLVRVLKTQFKKVTYVSNITDIDDKIIESSKDKKILTRLFFKGRVTVCEINSFCSALIKLSQNFC